MTKKFRPEKPDKTVLFTNLKTKHKHILKWLLLLVWPFLGFLLLPFSKGNFTAPFSTVIYSAEGRLLGAEVADDNQWRFPFLNSDTLPQKFETCILEFEDKAFYSHPGINPFSIARAIQQNWEAGKVVSGGSTITMQLARMYYQNQPRNIPQKIKELFLALRLELWLSKSEILNYYSCLAPYGGNVVGLETAAWRYYNRPAHHLSWGESALLAVLPNAPSLLYPGKNAELLEQKRNRLLDQLLAHGKMDSIANFLAKREELPLQPKPLPLGCYHLLQFIIKQKGSGQNFKTSIGSETQNKVQRIAQSFQRGLAGNGVNNLAILVVNNHTQKVVAYQGNLPQGGQHADKVDCVQSTRSTGSLLKPFLFASLLQSGTRTSASLIPDVPINISGFKPQNFTHNFSGAIPFQKALSKSLNIPFVIALRNFGIGPFLENLKSFGLKSIDKSAGYYGLSLILGGGESSLWELTQAFSFFGQKLNGNGVNAVDVILDSEPEAMNPLPFSDGVIFQTLTALTDVQRPGVQGNWKAFLSSQKIAWKTGTSYGHRDAWAIG
ncbi:MAG: penicillin-binding protein 1C, partial [Luteibaculaceae bacterium]